MNFKTLFSGYAAKNAGIKLLLITNVILLIAIVTLLAYTVFKKPIIVMKMPGVVGDSHISYDEASMNYKYGMAKYMAHTLGNVTPANAKFTKTTVADFFSPAIYQTAVKMLTDQVQRIKKEHISLGYNIRTVSLERETGKIFIEGMSTIELPTGSVKKRNKTYEIEVEIVNYMPVVTYIDSYSDTPKTIRRLRIIEGKNNQR